MDSQHEEWHISDIIVKKRLNVSVLTDEEERLLAEWLGESGENRRFYERMGQEEVYACYDRMLAGVDQEKHWERVERATRVSLKRKPIRWIAAAASVLLLFSLGLWFYYGGNIPADYAVADASALPGKNQAVLILEDGNRVELSTRDTLLYAGHSQIKIASGQVVYDRKESDSLAEGNTWNTIVVPRGGIYSLVLDDGSTVFLNSESELSYPVVFTGDSREVTLKGEAYFEVKPMTEKPFIVHAGTLATKVLGTTFNMMAYADEPEIQTTLISGKVEVTIAGTEIRRVLSPGMQSGWNQTMGQMAVRNVESRVYSMWRDGIIMLKGDSLESVIRMLARWYNVSYRFVQEQPASHSFTGKIDRNENLADVLNTLTLLGGPRFEFRENTIHIY